MRWSEDPQLLQVSPALTGGTDGGRSGAAQLA